MLLVAQHVRADRRIEREAVHAVAGRCRRASSMNRRRRSRPQPARCPGCNTSRHDVAQCRPRRARGGGSKKSCRRSCSRRYCCEPSSGSKITDVLAVLWIALARRTALRSLPTPASPTLPRLPRQVQQHFVGHQTSSFCCISPCTLLRCRAAENVRQPRPANLAAIDLRRQRDSRQQPRKLAARLRKMPPLLFDECAAGRLRVAGKTWYLLG